MGTTLEAIERDAGLPAQAESAVHVSDLVKTFPAPGGGTMTAVDHVSFTVQRGEIFGFLGPNGAGKTTVLEIIEGLQAPTAGRTTVLGLDSQHDRERVKQRIGVQLQAGAYFDYLTLEEILDLFGSTTHYMEEAQVLCDHVAIIDHGKIQALDTTSGLIHLLPAAYRLTFTSPDAVCVDDLTQLPGVLSATKERADRCRFELHVAQVQAALPAFVAWSAQSGLHIDDIQMAPATLEDAFLALTGRSLRE